MIERAYTNLHEKIIINGGRSLKGEVTISGAKIVWWPSFQQLF